MTKGIKEKDIRDFEKYAEKLNDVIVRIRKYCPEAQFYLACEVLNLMNGPSHGHPELGIKKGEVAASVLMKHTGGGDW